MFCLVPVKKLSTHSTFAPCAEQPLAQMRAEEAGAAGHQDSGLQMHRILQVWKRDVSPAHNGNCKTVHRFSPSPISANGAQNSGCA